MAPGAEGVNPAAAQALDELGPLLPPSLLGKLKQISLISRKVFVGKMKGERRSNRRGQSVEFADFRNYTPGDDPRFIDWNTYGRLERLYLKLFMEEEDLFVYLLLDCSASMNAPGKFRFAQALTAALAFISAIGQDHVAIGGFRGALSDIMRPKRGKGQAPRIIDFIEGLEAHGPTSLSSAVKRFLLENRRPGLAIVISDFLDPAGYEEALKMLQSRRFDVYALQILSPEELEPTLRGDLKLVDAETGESREISISPRLLDNYRAALQGYCTELQEFCKRRGIGYQMAHSGMDLEDLILKTFRTLGLVK